MHTVPMTPTHPPAHVLVRSDFGGGWHNVHIPIRTAGLPYSGPTVWLTACGLYAHDAVPADVTDLPLCASCEDDAR
jgi:hypothetical protein